MRRCLRLRHLLDLLHRFQSRRAARMGRGRTRARLGLAGDTVPRQGRDRTAWGHREVVLGRRTRRRVVSDWLETITARSRRRLHGLIRIVCLRIRRLHICHGLGWAFGIVPAGEDGRGMRFGRRLGLVRLLAAEEEDYAPGSERQDREAADDAACYGARGDGASAITSASSAAS